jgi:hypothetical protein
MQIDECRMQNERRDISRGTGDPPVFLKSPDMGWRQMPSKEWPDPRRYSAFIILHSALG